MFSGFWGCASRFDLFESLAASGEFGNDGIHGSGPDEWFRIFVPGGEEIFNCDDQIVNAEKRIASDAFVGQFGKPCSIRLSQLQLVGT
jgi:hypothetical protein